MISSTGAITVFWTIFISSDELCTIMGTFGMSVLENESFLIDIGKITKISSTIQEELQVAILKKAIIFEKEFKKKKKKFKRQDPN